MSAEPLTMAQVAQRIAEGLSGTKVIVSSVSEVSRLLIGRRIKEARRSNGERYVPKRADPESVAEYISLEARRLAQKRAALQTAVRERARERVESKIRDRAARSWSVYVMWDDHHRQSKIGFSCNLTRRLEALTKDGRPGLMLVSDITCSSEEEARLVESALHFLYRRIALHGEWFALNPVEWVGRGLVDSAGVLKAVLEELSKDG